MTTALGRDPLVSPRPQLWRISDRASFVALRRDGRRARRGAVTVTWLPGTDVEPQRAAFALGRSVGGAVVRNRIRRRLRSALRTMVATGELPAGTYLVGGTRELADCSWDDLVGQLAAAVTAATEDRP